jgi:hypothetical protein
MVDSLGKMAFVEPVSLIRNAGGVPKFKLLILLEGAVAVRAGLALGCAEFARYEGMP